jgi:DNA-binding response OmpR family regulator
VASILVSEVEPDVRQLLTRLVERQGHDAIVLEPDVAVPPRADLLLADPSSSMSVEHIRLVRAFDPDVPLVAMSALPDRLGRIGGGAVHFLLKPFSLEQIGAVLARALDRTDAVSPI